jgi:hypothetical protein
MSPNLGSIDRSLRISVGLALIAAYTLLGLRTCPMTAAKH